MLSRKLLTRQHTVTETATYLGSAEADNTTEVTQTFASFSLGRGYAGRRLVICAASNVVGSTVGQITGLTVGGIAATELVSSYYTVSNTLGCAIFIIDYPFGSTADIAVTVNVAGTDGNRIIFVYALDSNNSGTAVTGSDQTSPYQFTRTFVSGDFYFGIGRTVSTNTDSWTNATEQGQVNHSGNIQTSTALYGPATAGALTITYTPTTSSSSLSVSAVIPVS